MKTPSNPASSRLPVAGWLAMVMISSSCQPLHISMGLQNQTAISDGPLRGVQLERPPSPPVTNVEVGTRLRANDRLATPTDTFVELTDPSGTQIIVYPGSSIGISSILVYVGRIFVRIRGQFETGDTETTAGAKGTRYFVDVQGRTATYTVLEGAITVRSKRGAGAWTPVLVRAGERVSSQAGQQPVRQVFTGAEWNRLMEQAKRLETELDKGVPGPSITPGFPDDPFGPRSFPRRRPRREGTDDHSPSDHSSDSDF